MAKGKFKYRTKTKNIYRKARGGGGKFKPVIDGGLAGLLGGLATNYVGEWGHPGGALAIGWFRNNNVLLTEGAREAGALIASMLPGIGGGNEEGGW